MSRTAQGNPSVMRHTEFNTGFINAKYVETADSRTTSSLKRYLLKNVTFSNFNNLSVLKTLKAHFINVNKHLLTKKKIIHFQ